MMSSRFYLPLIFALVLSACHAETPSDSSSLPGWVKTYRESPAVAWSGWQNALKPKGEAALPIQLASEGETDYRILIPVEPSVAEQRAAEELRLWLGEITGAEFKITDDPDLAGQKSLRVGRVEGSPFVGTEPDLGDLDDGRYEIRVSGDTVYFEGPGLNGPLNAVYAFLEEDIGVRWLDGPRGDHPKARKNWSWTKLFKQLDEMLESAPDLAGIHYVPTDANLSVAIVPRESIPAFATRGFTVIDTCRPWGLRNRLNFAPNRAFNQRFYSGGLFVHTFHTLVPPSQYFDSHPEYFSYIDGEWRWEHAQINMSNPEVIEIAAQKVISRLRNAPPGQRMASISPMDWKGYSEDPESLRQMEEFGGLTGLVLHFANQVTARVVEEVPDATLTVLSYADYNLAPAVDIDLHPNLAIRYCADWGATFDFPYHSFYDSKLGEPIETNNPSRYTPQLPSIERWMELTDNFHLWQYPTQYRNNLAPMPNIRAVAENLRFFEEKGFASAFVEQYVDNDQSRANMRFWVWSKLMWDPSLNVELLMRDFIGAYYGAAAPAVWEYHCLLWDYAARYNDYESRRSWIYSIDDEGMFDHGFLEKARVILDSGMTATEDPEIQERVELLELSIDYVEMSRLLRSLREGQFTGDRGAYRKSVDSFFARAERLGVVNVKHYDGWRSERTVDEFREAFELAEIRMFEQNFLPAEQWAEWEFRLDPEDVGVANHWYQGEGGLPEDWEAVPVPAFLGQGDEAAPTGYFWYRVSFKLTAKEAASAANLLFGAVDEQAWVYLNGEYLGEHTLQSEFVVGDDIGVEDLWDRSFSLSIDSERLKEGSNSLYVRVHNSAFNGGIYRPVELEIVSVSKPVILEDDFSGGPLGSSSQGTEFDTDRSSAFGSWTVTDGSVSLDGSKPSALSSEPGEAGLTFGVEGASVQFNLNELIRGRVELSFDLRQLEGLSSLSTFKIFFEDSNGHRYHWGLSTTGNYYGGPVGRYGFAIFDPNKTVRVGTRGAHLRSDSEWQKIRLVLDPVEGASFYYDGSSEPMIQLVKGAPMMSVASIELCGRRDVTWQIDNLELKFSYD